MKYRNRDKYDVGGSAKNRRSDLVTAVNTATGLGNTILMRPLLNSPDGRSPASATPKRAKRSNTMQRSTNKLTIFESLSMKKIN